jgi:hypothetical protein
MNKSKKHLYHRRNQKKKRKEKRREGKGREGKGREGKGREGKGREGKGREGKERKGGRKVLSIFICPDRVDSESVPWAVLHCLES